MASLPPLGQPTLSHAEFFFVHRFPAGRPLSVPEAVEKSALSLYFVGNSGLWYAGWVPYREEDLKHLLLAVGMLLALVPPAVQARSPGAEPALRSGNAAPNLKSAAAL